jgi:hypothetical protein
MHPLRSEAPPAEAKVIHRSNWFDLMFIEMNEKTSNFNAGESLCSRAFEVLLNQVPYP